MFLTDIDPHDEIFEFLDEQQKRWFFNSTRLYPYAVRCGELIKITNLPELARHVEKFNGVEEAKIQRLREPWLSVPVLGVLWPDGTTVVVDGNHRLVKLYRAAKTEAMMYRLPRDECKFALITDVPEGTSLFGVVPIPEEIEEGS